ncbi:MAG: polyprenol monophosphomannose synthase [Candidatus Beckwithbacteria bacterium]
MKTVIVIPTYNESKSIKQLISIIFSILPQGMVIVVDDNSPDKTANLVKPLLKRYKNLHLIVRTGKGGRGSAVMAGFKYAFKHYNSDIYIEMDADLSHEPKELKQLISMSKSNNIILASRYLSKSKIVNWPIKRHIASRVSNLLVRLVLKLPLRDNTNGYRCYQKKAIKVLLNHQFINQGYMVLSESAYLLYQKGFELIEVPSVFVSKFMEKSNATIKEFLTAFRGLLQIKESINSKPTKD